MQILCLILEGFYLKHFPPLPPEEAGKAVVIHDGEAPLDLSPEAMARGAKPGMSLKEMKSLLREEGRFVQVNQDQSRQDALAWWDLCAECSDGVECPAPHRAFVDLSHHPQPDEVGEELVRRLHRLLGLRIKACLAPSKWLGGLFAEPCAEVALSAGIPCLPCVADPAKSLAPLPTSLLAPLPPELRERLIFLGCRRVGQIQQEPLHLLMRHFGKEGAFIHQLAWGRWRDQLTPQHPPESATVEIPLGGETEDAQALQQALHLASQELAMILGERDRTAGALRLIWRSEGGTWHGVHRPLSKALCSTISFLAAFNRMLADSPPPFPPVGLTARAEKLEVRPSFQRTLLGGTAKAEREAAISGALKNVQAMYGEGHVIPADQVSLPRRQRVLLAWRRSLGWR